MFVLYVFLPTQPGPWGLQIRDEGGSLFFLQGGAEKKSGIDQDRHSLVPYMATSTRINFGGFLKIVAIWNIYTVFFFVSKLQHTSLFQAQRQFCPRGLPTVVSSLLLPLPGHEEGHHGLQRLDTDECSGQLLTSFASTEQITVTQLFIYSCSNCANYKDTGYIALLFCAPQFPIHPCLVKVDELCVVTSVQLYI